MYIVLRSLVVAGTERQGGHYVGTDRQSDKQVGQQTDQRCRGTDRGQRFVSRKMSHDDDVGGVEQKLQPARKHQRHAEGDDPRQDRAITHIEFSGFPGHYDSLRFRFFRLI